MGWREVSAAVPDTGDEVVVEYIRQLSAFGAFYGCEPDFHAPTPDVPAGVISFSLDGNSGWLNDFTPFFIEGARQIAADIDTGNAVLKALAEAIDDQLTSQLSTWDSAITSGREGREFLQRSAGDGSFVELGEDLRVHADRLRDDLHQLATQSGPTAWRSRIDIERRARLDSTGILLTAQRLRRVAKDVASRVPGDHLATAVESFDAHAPGLYDLRNIAEHLDDYVIGRGRLDVAGTEPGDVFRWRIAEHDVEVSARSRRVHALVVAERAGALVRCLTAAVSHHAIAVAFPVLAGFDFIERRDDGTWRILDPSEENQEQREFRESAERFERAPIKLPQTDCPECGEFL